MKKAFHKVLFDNVIQSLENGEWEKYYGKYKHTSKALLEKSTFNVRPWWIFSSDSGYNAERISFNYRESRKISKAIEQNNSRRSLRVLLGTDPVDDDEILEAQSNLRKWTTS